MEDAPATTPSASSPVTPAAGAGKSWIALAGPYVLGAIAFLVITFPFIWLKLNFTSTGEVFAQWNQAGGIKFWRNMGPVFCIAAVFALIIWIYDHFKIQKQVDVYWTPADKWMQKQPLAPFVLPVLLIIYGFSGQFNFLYAPSPTLLNQGILVGIYMILAMGLNIVIGYTGLLVLGYAGFVGFGAFAFAVAQKPDMIPGLPWWAALPVVFIMGGLVGWLIGLPCIRLRGDYLAIVTLGFAEGFRELCMNLQLTGTFNGIQISAASKLGDFADRPWIFAYIVVIVVLCASAIYRIYHSPVGRAWIAIREDEVAAGAMGIPVVRMKLLAFSLSAAFAAIGGLLSAAYTGYINPEVANFEKSVTVLAMVILGGLGSLPGVLAGAALLYLLPELLRDYVSMDYRLLIFGSMMIVMMLFRPQGLLGTSRHATEMKGG
ncbi:MAG: branched-chain amino acid ABC transporter permease [Candidatus Methylacidiphilales bacterium]|nr:branched-chain amino acid ABC transporter permease [Candidatus Methylacidiphilales bacterium]